MTENTTTVRQAEIFDREAPTGCTRSESLTGDAKRDAQTLSWLYGRIDLGAYGIRINTYRGAVVIASEIYC